ncbi:MAG: T9SS type A sorting domain-containing protein [Bacteroidota bacterium]
MCRLYCLFSLFILLISGSLAAQDCFYQVVLEDELGDGWNGAELTVRTNQVFRYTISEEAGDRAVFFFPVSDGQPINVDLTPGAFPEELSFSIFDNADSLIFQSGPPAVTGTSIFVYSAVCNACVPPAANSIDIFRVRATTADIRFNRSSLGTNPLYLLEYGLGEYDPATDEGGVALVLQDTFRRITNLQSDTMYTFWLSTICQTENDTTIRRGPFPIMTQKAADVGITQLPFPATGCNLGLEEVTIGITNFGGEAQAFFDVNFSINGGDPIAAKPNDGIFTGVVGVDSTEFFTFDAQAFLSAPGTYTITAWTSLEEDEDRMNDTMEFTVVHVPQLTTFPYFEDFEASDGFWYAERAGRGISSWRWGEPFAPFIDRAPNGERAWVTNPGGDYNDRELSYLVSPCFDLRAMEDDPLFSATLRVRTETDFDAVWLEMTTDDGATWEKVISSPASTTWYNDLANQVWEGDGGFGDRPALVSNLLAGAAGNIVQLRFVLETSRSTTMEGVLVDRVGISERAPQDLALVSVSRGTDCAAVPPYRYVVTVANLGTEPVDSFTINFNVDGTDAAETVDQRLMPGQTLNLVLETGAPPNYDVAPLPFWTALAGDTNLANDTIRLIMPTVVMAPFFASFDNGELPDGWALGADGFALLPDPQTTSPSLVTTNNSRIVTARYDSIMMGDSLKFTVSLPEMTDFTASLRIIVQDCDTQFDLVMVDSLVSQTYAFALENDMGPIEGGTFIFEVTLTGEDTVVAFDNINITRCPENLDLIAEFVGVSAAGATDAIASVTPLGGIPPYTFIWSTGDAEQQVDGLAEGELSVIVTDVAGCRDTVFFTVDQTTSAEDPNGLLAGLKAQPNPTTSTVDLRLDLPEVRSLQASVFDLTGRQLFFRDLGRQRLLNERIDFSSFPAGIYLLRLQADDAARTLRVIRR